MYNQTWKDQQTKPETVLQKVIAVIVGGACIAVPIIVGIIQYTN